MGVGSKTVRVSVTICMRRDELVAERKLVLIKATSPSVINGGTVCGDDGFGSGYMTRGGS